MKSAGKTTEQLLEEIDALHAEIAECQRAERVLRESEERYRTLIENIPIGIYRNTPGPEGKFLMANPAFLNMFGFDSEEELKQATVADLYLDPDERRVFSSTLLAQGSVTGVELLLKKNDGTPIWGLVTAQVVHAGETKEATYFDCTIQDITKRKWAEEALRWRNRELALLNQASQAFSSTLELDQVLAAVLEEVRRLLGVVACSVWLINPETEELVCRQATGPQSEVVRGWRLASGEGIAGWVTQHAESLIVPDTQNDERHFKGVDQETGLDLRSILAVPLKVKERIIGVLQVVDTEVGRFGARDLELTEPLATTAAIAIENARLYEQARQDARTKSLLLHEVNHRVKNNLAAIMGLLRTEQLHASTEVRPAYQAIAKNLTNRLQGLATVHGLLSSSEWAPLPLSELSAQVIRSALQTLPRDKSIRVEVTPSTVRVTSDQAHNLGLVINELATNTAKHALRERDTGQIVVHIALEDDTVLLEFRDDGPGYPEGVLQSEQYNAGLELIQNIVRKTLRGELSLRNDQGAVALLQFRSAPL
jgi:PAS domain S-box-containing protein